MARLLESHLFSVRRSSSAPLPPAPTPPVASTDHRVSGRPGVSGPEVLKNSNALAARGRFAEALALLDRALEQNRNDHELLLARASVLYGWGRLHEAFKGFQRAEAAGLRGPTLDGRIGWTCLQIGLAEEAEARMRSVVSARPDAAEAHFSLGAVLASRKSYEEAISCYGRSLELEPDHKHCLVNLGIAYLRSGDLPNAEKTFRRAAECYPDNPIVWMNLGTVLHRSDREEAFDAFSRAESLDLDLAQNPDNFSNYGNALQNFDRVGQAIELYERYLPSCPLSVGHGNYSMALLTAGRWLEGWNHYEFRWMQEALAPLRAEFDKPMWAGQDLHGKKILLRAEQGIGDVIQFIRYAPLVKALGAHVVLLNRAGMDELSQRFPGVDHVLQSKEGIPEFDYYAHLMSLPRIFGTEVDSVPDDVPYLYAEPERVQRWRARLANDQQLKVGLVWAGVATHVRDRYRSTSLEALAPLLESAGVSWYSLQKGPPAVALSSHRGGNPITDLQDELTDFAETAAAISALDLVISVDTSVAHLTGALGKPLWLMLPHPAEWRWLERRDDTPWYPTARLFRQSRMGDWDSAVRRMKPMLLEAAAQFRPNEPLPATLGPRIAPSKRPALVPKGFRPVTVRSGMSAVWEMRAGILQYLPDEDDDANRSLHWYGEWLEPQLDLLTRLIRRGQTIVEGGAGVGAHAVPLARALGPEGHLITYETHPRQLRILRQNLAANGIGNVTVMSRALTGADDAVSSPGEDGGTPDSETIDQLRLERLDWLKLGSRVLPLAILSGAVDTLWRLRPRLFITLPTSHTIPQLTRNLKDFSYRCWRIETPLFNPANFNNHGADVFDGRMAYAILAIPEEIEVDVALDGCVEVS